MPQLDIVVSAIDETRAGLASAARGIDQTEKKVSRLGKASRLAGKAIGGIAVAGAGIAVGLGKELFDTAKELRELSAISNASGEALQVLGKIAESSGGSAEDVADAYREMQLRLTEASELASGPAVDALKILGLSLSDLEGLNADEQFDLLRDAISGVEDPAQRLFVAEELLGGAAERLNAVLNPTAAEFDSLADSTKRAGVISDEAIDGIGRLSDGYAMVKQRVLAFTADALVGLVDWIRSDVVPVMREWGEWIDKNLVPVLQRMREIAVAVFGAIQQGLDILAAAWRADWEGVRTTTEQVWETVRRVVLVTIEEIQAVIQRVARAISEWWEANWEDLARDTLEVMLAIRDGIRDAVEWIRELVIRVGEAIRVAWITDWEGIRTFTVGVWDAIRRAVDVTINEIRALIMAGLELLRSLWHADWTQIGKDTLVVLGNIRDTIRDIIERIHQIITTTVTAIRDAWQTDWYWIRTVTLAVWTAIQAAIDATIVAIKATIQATMSAIRTLWNADWANIRDETIATITTIYNIVSTTIQVIYTVVSTTIKAIHTAITTTINAIRTVWENDWGYVATITKLQLRAIWEIIKLTITVIKEFIVAAVKVLTTTFKVFWVTVRTGWAAAVVAWDKLIRPFLSAVATIWGTTWDVMLVAIRVLWTAITGVWRAGVATITGFVDRIVAAVQRIIDTARRAIDIVGKIPGAGAITSGIGKVGSALRIPGFAEGGIVTRPTLAVIGEAGPEAVVPLDRYNRGGGSSSGPMVANLILDRETIGQFIIERVNQGARAGELSVVAEFG